MSTVAQGLVDWLTLMGTEVIFGIPGVHTIELYRALPGAGIRHVTPRHEAGAGFMADGYARASGRFGVALVITGPGLTNILTPMAQARADSVPMLVISGVNQRDALGKGCGHLHELPDQQALVAKLCPSFHLDQAEDLPATLAQIAQALTTGRPGPVHLQIPLDLMAAPLPGQLAPFVAATAPSPDLTQANRLLAQAQTPVILAGGGCRGAGSALKALAERLGAPVILTTNARGLMHGHPLGVPASPSLGAVRDLIRNADRLLVLGSELGRTDCDMVEDGKFPATDGMIRVDIDPDQLARHPAALTVQADVATILPRLTRAMPAADGPARAAHTRDAARAALPAGYEAEVVLLERLREGCPGAIMVGDSTQVIYAGNLFYDHDRPGGWFNAATGYGALGYAPGAAVGAALAAPEARILCLIGDGGLMFSPGELLTAAEEGLDITFIVFNNAGFGEIATAMRSAGAQVLGCTPRPPDFADLASACDLPFERVTPQALQITGSGPRLIEVTLPPVQ
ncbi:5-guanidino-2-oxopentanoate decarboxylase [Roseovarius autotrophicus]|uniref:5-guanidino-2-oxopentanoate decarboxylase n=1 Tax=Roseovarius autotrophicus TaxID=2824121 RepID=UPI0019DBA639|nr:5-guanidino-2-oxopentanoate decarboxylase [Roseovarius autotrophicus]MBE0453140.1 5-guanidino-2-oxopentanoate decarboxylase [Roseovarius sp.]